MTTSTASRLSSPRSFVNEAESDSWKCKSGLPTVRTCMTYFCRIHFLKTLEDLKDARLDGVSRQGGCSGETSAVNKLGCYTWGRPMAARRESSPCSQTDERHGGGQQKTEKLNPDTTDNYYIIKHRCQNVQAKRHKYIQISIVRFLVEIDTGIMGMIVCDYEMM